MDSLIIQFPGGADTTLTGISIDQQLFVKEGITTGISPITSPASLRCFPNPAKKSFSIELNVVNAEMVTLRLMNVAGITISERKVSVKSGKNLIQWTSDEADTLRGIYFIEASGKNWKEKTKLTMQ